MGPARFHCFPQGFKQFDKDGNELVMKLNKSIYGLKQSGRNWYKTLSSFLIESNFSQSEIDNCVYTRKTDDSLMIIIVWVDDLLIASPDEAEILSMKSVLCQRFKMSDFGCIKNFLGGADLLQ